MLKKIVVLAVVVTGLAYLPAKATPLYGTLNYTGDVRVFNNGGVGTVDFLGGVVVGRGDALASGISNIGSFSPFNGASAAARSGTTFDISSASVYPIIGFLDWNAAPAALLNNMSLDLLALVPSSAPLGCPAVMAIGDVCAPFPGSPFTLTRVATGSQAQIVGFVRITEGGDTVFGTLNISAQFSANPDAIVAMGLTAAGTPLTTFSATVNTIPEPGAAALALLGLGVVALSLRVRRAR